MKQHLRKGRIIGKAEIFFLACVLLLAAGLPPGAATAAEAYAYSPAENPLAALEHGLRPTQLKAAEAAPGWSLQERMAHYHVPGVAIAVLKDGVVVQAAGFGVRQAGTTEAVELRIVEGTLELLEQGRDPLALAALTPSRFVTPGDQDQVFLQFHRDVYGAVTRMIAERGTARIYFRRAQAAKWG